MLRNVNYTLGKIDGKRNGKNAKKWVVRLSYYDENNKRHTTTKATGLFVSDKGSKKQADEIGKVLLNEYMQKYNSKSANWYVHEWVKNWYDNIESKLVGKPKAKHGITLQTYNSYKHQVNRIVSYFEKNQIKLDELKSRDLEDFYDYEYENDYNSNTIRKDHSTINKALRSACRDEVIFRNVAQFADAPKKEKYQAPIPYKEEEVIGLLKLLEGNELQVPIFLSSLLGLRRSEALGLKWDCVDFSQKTITVKRIATYRNSKQVVVDSTKNESSNRTFTIDDNWLKLLRSLKIEHDKKYLASGGTYNKENLVCVRDNGKPLDLRETSKAFKVFLEKNNLRVIRFHDLRHTCASILYSKGWRLKEISTYLGHSNVNTTADIYTYLFEDKKEGMTSDMSSLMVNIV